MMTFMMKKKKYKFQVELKLEELTAVPFVNAVLFAKVRLLDGGSFSDTSSREEVSEHAVRWGAKFVFVCKMSANASTGILDPCLLRISVRKEVKGGRTFQKLGFTDLNLAEFAGAGETTKRCLLEGYDTRHRQDNSMLRVTIRMDMLSGDILFKVPTADTATTPQPAQEETGDHSGGSIASGSSGFGSLPKKRPPLNQVFNTDPVPTILDHSSELMPPPPVPLQLEDLVQDSGLGNHEPGHSRNNSNTSQMSKASGYSSLSQSQHSRQSSSGDSGHTRLLVQHRKLLDGAVTNVAAMKQGMRCSDEDLLREDGSPTELMQRRKSTPNPSSGSGLSESGGGSLERAKIAAERRKKPQEDSGIASLSDKESRVGGTRVNPDDLIAELLQETNFNPDETAETSGLQLFIAPDGSTALGSHQVKSETSSRPLKQVVMDKS